MSELHIPRVAILASGSGTTAEAYAQAIHNGEVNHNIDLVVASKDTAGILERVPRWNRELGFDTEAKVMSKKDFPRGGTLRSGEIRRGKTLEQSEAIAELMWARKIGTIVLLGEMEILGGALMTEFGFQPDFHKSPYEARIINSHPGILPYTADTMGPGASQRAIDMSLLYTAHTLHVVSKGVDRGPILEENLVPIKPGQDASTVFANVQVAEKLNIAAGIDRFIGAQQEFINAHDYYLEP
jgi:folate-dependent phosphoribosylglycinamide formyltransferase PurN